MLFTFHLSTYWSSLIFSHSTPRQIHGLRAEHFPTVSLRRISLHGPGRISFTLQVDSKQTTPLSEPLTVSISPTIQWISKACNTLRSLPLPLLEEISKPLNFTDTPTWREVSLTQIFGAKLSKRRNATTWRQTLGRRLTI